MAKFFRRRFRRRSTSRRFTRRIRKFPRPGTKRFFRRQRRLPKPEIKWVMKSVQEVIFGRAERSIIDSLIPDIIVGSDVNSRIGKEVKFRKLLHNLTIWTNFYQPTQEASQDYDAPVRLVIWSPVTTFATAAAYINGTAPFAVPLDNNAIFDWNIMRVHKDTWFRMGRGGVYQPLVGETDPVMQSSGSQMTMKRTILPIPRTVHFPSNNVVDIDRYQVYMTLFKQASNVDMQYSWTSKTTYIDS
ncbi:MAG: capsid protein [Wigfec virus K19_605]|nr:MAG: capsid protein [Wigfec virus K19_605]